MSRNGTKNILKTLAYAMGCVISVCSAEPVTSTPSTLPFCGDLDSSDSPAILTSEVSRVYGMNTPSFADKFLQKGPNSKEWQEYLEKPYPIQPKSLVREPLRPQTPELPKQGWSSGELKRRNFENALKATQANRGIGGASDSGKPLIGSTDGRLSSEGNRGIGLGTGLPLGPKRNLPPVIVPGDNDKQRPGAVKLPNRHPFETVMSGTIEPGGYSKINLSKLGKKEPVAVDSVKGKRCWRGALPSDATTPFPGAGTTKIMIDPFGFREVGVLLSQKGNDIHVCSFVLVHPRYALTATHCLWMPNSSKQEPESVLDNADRVLWLYPKRHSPANKAELCFDDGPQCAFDHLEVQEKFHAPNLQWAKDNNTWAQDISLVQFKQPIADKEFRYPTLPPLSRSKNILLSSRTMITTAGYGGNSQDLTATKPAFGNLGVGVQTLLGQYSDELTWIKDSSSAVAGVCFGDSGGPLYKGWVVGMRDETHELLGINSRLLQADLQGEVPAIDSSKLDERVTQCLDGKLQSRAQLVAKALPWICAHTANELSNCKQ